MSENGTCELRLAELIDVDLPADELERIMRVDALLREAAARGRSTRRDGARSIGVVTPRLVCLGREGLAVRGRPHRERTTPRS